MAPLIEALPQKYNNRVAIRKINIVSWKSDAFKQAKDEFGVKAIPYLRIYGTDGEFLGEETFKGKQIEDLTYVEELIQKTLK